VIKITATLVSTSRVRFENEEAHLSSRKVCHLLMYNFGSPIVIEGNSLLNPEEEEEALAKRSEIPTFFFNSKSGDDDGIPNANCALVEGEVCGCYSGSFSWREGTIIYERISRHSSNIKVMKQYAI
jgi:hypothetical protein